MSFGYSLPRKKVSVSYGNLRFSQITNFKKGLFHRVKESFKSNQTRYGVSHGHLKSNTKRNLAIACLGKK